MESVKLGLRNKAVAMYVQHILALVLVVGKGISSSSSSSSSSSHSDGNHPSPTPWPEQFHALLYMNLTDGRLQITDLWYDWEKGRNVNIMQKQLGEKLYDVEWNNGTSFYYTLPTSDSKGTCKVMLFEVGILRPDWLVDGSHHVGIQSTDGFLCNVWEKADFIVYYEDVVTKVPVRWDFYDGISTHVMTFEAGAVLVDSQVQAPPYCFAQHTDTDLHCFAANSPCSRLGNKIFKYSQYQ